MPIWKNNLTLLLAALLLVLGCNTADRLLTGDEIGPLATYNVDADQSVILAGGQPRTLDPAATRGGPDGPIGGIFSGLVTLDTELQVQPDLAAGWDISDDGTVYTFYLRPEARFHDGRPVTAADVIYSWERATDPETGSDTAQTYLGDVIGVTDKLAGRSAHIAGLRAIDDHTLEVRIDAPKVYFLSKLTYPVAFVVDRVDVGRADWEHMPNGSGPFRLQEWRDDEVLILSRNADHYLTPPAVGQVVYLMGGGIPLTMYEKDEIDLVVVGGSTLERVRDPNSPLFPDLRTGPDMCTNFVSFNNRLPPFDDPLIRQAFSYAVDRQRLVDGYYMGNVLPATGPLPPGMPGYTGDSEPHTFDPQKARELLAQAGYEDASTFPTLTFTSSGYGGVDGLVTALITMWQENLGVTIEPTLLEPYVYFDELYAGNVGSIFSHGWCADYPDPENFLDILYHSGSAQNLGGYSNAAVDTLLEQARVEPDVNARMGLYAEIERRIVSDAPAVFLTHGLSAVLAKPYLKDYVLTPIGVAQWQRVSVDK
jgi:oligopeptide transport system substrate-binding protein